MTSFQQHNTTSSGVSYEIINNFCVSEPIDLKPKLKRNYTIVCYLAVLAVCSFGAVFTFSTIMKRFHTSSCFLDTKFRFNHGLHVPEDSISENNSSLDPLKYLSIDRHRTSWSRHETCDSVTYPPVIMGMSALIWASMFYVCSMTDRNHKSVIPNPWRIVFPAVLYFAFMAVLSIYYCVKVHELFSEMCLNLAIAFDKDAPSCATLMDQLTQAGLVKTSALYISFFVFIYFVLVLWVALSALLLLRCLFGVDFQKISVDIKPLSAPVSPLTPRI